MTSSRPCEGVGKLPGALGSFVCEVVFHAAHRYESVLVDGQPLGLTAGRLPEEGPAMSLREAGGT